MKTTAIVVAAGEGKRMKMALHKPFIQLRGIPILGHTLSLFEGADEVSEVVVVISPEHVEQCEKGIVQTLGLKKVSCLVPGGKTRQESVYQGLVHSDPESELVMVHDGVRPFLSHDLIHRCIEKARVSGGALVALPMNETVKRVGEDGSVQGTVDRKSLWRAQTPQVFRKDLLEKAHQQAIADGFEGTDEASLVEQLGEPIQIVEGVPENIKITTQEDLALAEFLLQRREERVRVES